MSVVKSRHHELSVQINDVRSRSFQVQNIGFLADGENSVASQCHSVRALHFMERRTAARAGVDVGVNVDDIGFGRGLILGEHGGERE